MWRINFIRTRDRVSDAEGRGLNPGWNLPLSPTCRGLCCIMPLITDRHVFLLDLR